MPIAVSPAAPHEVLPALRRLLSASDGGDADRRADHCRDTRATHTTTDARSGADPRLGADALLVARDATGRVCGAVGVQTLAGALAVIWPPRGDTPEAEDALAAAAHDWLRSHGVKVCQAYARPDQADPLRSLERVGFRLTTRVLFLRRDRPAVPPRTRLRFSPEPPPFSDDFRSALLATHQDTLDCPELNDGRTPEEVLAGFTEPAGTASFRACDDTGIVGVVVLATGDGTDPTGDVTVSYLGVVPEARGRGHGSDLLRFALAQADRGVALAVDARNEPALRLYSRHGFRETGCRAVWLAHLPFPRL
jgi:ribosomal protein S18 acetylase RimI-like enzyme